MQGRCPVRCPRGRVGSMANEDTRDLGILSTHQHRRAIIPASVGVRAGVKKRFQHRQVVLSLKKGRQSFRNRLFESLAKQDRNFRTESLVIPYAFPFLSQSIFQCCRRIGDEAAAAFDQKMQRPVALILPAICAGTFCNQPLQGGNRGA
ncbi:hypothetical protein D9M71_383840 [compost metagenome]